MRIQRRYTVTGQVHAGEDIRSFSVVIRASSPERAEDAVRKHLQRAPRYFGKTLKFFNIEIKSS